MERDQEFLEFVIKSLVENPDKVVVDRTVDEMGVLLTLTVGPEDMGTVIGRQGNTAKAVRTLLRVVGMKNDARVNLKINEPEGGLRSGGGDMGAPASTPAEEEAPRPEAADVDAAMDELKA